MRVLVTAGNTLVPLDKVRCLTNIFTGRTGAAVALAAHARGHAVTLLTSHPEAVDALRPEGRSPADQWRTATYRTFDDLAALMAENVTEGGFDAVIHSAAVSDYLFEGAYAPAPGAPRPLDRGVGKIKSDEPELWLRLVRAPKLVDRVRTDWRFRGVLVKFKLEVGISDDALLAIAEKSRRHSGADVMVANTLEGAAEYAFLGPVGGGYERVDRPRLAGRLLEVVEDHARGEAHG